MTVLPYLVAGWIFLIGVYGLVTSRDLIHAVGCLAVTQSSTYVLLLAVGYRNGGTAPVFADAPTDSRWSTRSSRRSPSPTSWSARP
ncbi:hypothetical protein GCM10017744_022370 [Streptomyces antimycoticus]